ncbi:MAG: sigma-54-dependent Fis family transcriptional regulator [Ignavibacteria bacterium]|nr:sigma-54-dependent Fis family transcriptional regulator [Ignavibacteria bacterium]
MNHQEFQDKFGLFYRSQLMREVVEVIQQVSATDITVLIQGESGTGKELVAKAIHGLSKRSSNKLLSVNCGAIPEGIIESELFGHQKGAFTGAIESRKGYFELADEGSLFLDEIGELPTSVQVKFLRVLETKEILRIGAETVSKVDVRFITATNKDLNFEVSKKKFREDLFYRLRSVMIEIPPLRKRKEDIPLLANKFLADFCMRNKIEQIRIDDQAYDFLIEYHWPGNVRELKNAIESASALNKTGILKSEDFGKNFVVSLNEMPHRNLPIHLNKSADEAERGLILSALIEIKKDLVDLKNAIINDGNEVQSQNNPVSIKEVQKEAIKNALIKTHYNKKKAASMLNISLRTLYRKIKEYGLSLRED